MVLNAASAAAVSNNQGKIINNDAIAAVEAATAVNVVTKLNNNAKTTTTPALVPTQVVATKQPQTQVPNVNRILDFLSAAGKIATILLAVTPLPTYLGVWNRPKKE